MPGLDPDPVICGHCFRRGFADFLRRAELPAETLEGYLNPIRKRLSQGDPPPLAGARAWREMRKASGKPDIFMEDKRWITLKLMENLDSLRKRFLESPEPVMSALSGATWCNLIDSAQGRPGPEPEELLETLEAPLALDGRRDFIRALKNTDSLLILGDNAGETVMDRLFLEITGFSGRVFYMVRPLPVMNDATRKDAEMAGIHRFARIVDSGSDLPSVIPDLLSPQAARVFRESGLILAKGQGNLEGLWGMKDPRIHHAFVVKCPVVSRATGLPQGSGVFVSSPELEV